MDTYWLYKYLVVLFGTFDYQGVKSEVTIFPYNLTVLEGSDGTVRCTYDGINTLQGATFTLNNTNIASIFTTNCTFNLLNTNNYKTDCEGNRTVILTMINISRHNHGKYVQCNIFLFDAPPESSANEALVYVNVPVTSVPITSPAIIYGILSVCEDEDISLHCTTSASRPAAYTRWIYQRKSSTGDITTVPVDGNTSVREKNGLFITSSTLYTTTNRSLNSWHIFCSSTNYPDIIVNSSSIDFDILYPPEDSPTILNVNITNGDTYKIIEGRQGLLTCAVPTSNPNAMLAWIGLQHRHNIATTLDYVSNSLEWMASRHDTNISTCITKHECKNFTKTISVNIQVLCQKNFNIEANLLKPNRFRYVVIMTDPPTIKPMKDISIVEDSLLNKTCDINSGIPEAVTINWTRQTNKMMTNSRLLTIQNVTRHFTSNYTCYVANIMKPTIGVEERGESKSFLHIDVLYPPTVKPIKNQTAIEGEDFNLSCQVNPGNPKATTILWTSNDRIIKTVGLLSFKNISRKNAAIYTCTASNMMNPTNGTQVKGNDSKNFNLIVEYRATIKEFFIDRYNNDRSVTLKEHENIIFHCNVDSLPISTLNITFQGGNKRISHNSTNNFTYNLGPATCLGAGIYECSAKNKHNSIQEDAIEQLNLFVYCSPRAHPEMRVKSNVTTALNVPLVLIFSAVAYPLPYTVKWKKINISNWTTIKTYNQSSIKQSDLIFNLTFSNVQQEDLGLYKLVIINDIDEFYQNFTIIPADVPNPPTACQALTDTISTSSITVKWLPSFNGGQPQHFVLNICKFDVHIWTSRTIEDNGDTYMNYTFEGLSSGTLYKVRIYAENTIGRSNVSDKLIFQTLDVLKEDPEGSSFAIVLGCVSGVVGSILVVILAIWFARKRFIPGPKRDSNDVVYQNNLYLSDRNDNETNYESLDENQRDKNEYSQLSRNNRHDGIITNNTNQHVTCDEFERITQVPIYTNLKL